jgi:hypothetical protein
MIPKSITSLTQAQRDKIATELKKIPLNLRVKVIRELQRRQELAQQAEQMASHAKDGA